MKEKLIVKWNKELKEFHVTHPSINVRGFGKTISQAMDNWIWWWQVPF